LWHVTAHTGLTTGRHGASHVVNSTLSRRVTWHCINAHHRTDVSPPEHKTPRTKDPPANESRQETIKVATCSRFHQNQTKSNHVYFRPL